MPNYKLGKLPPKIDSRTIKLKSILRVDKLPDIPLEYDIDSVLGVVDNNMYLNDTYGDCVIAGRAHMTLRFEKYEQQTLIPITDEEVKTQYFKETGGSDSGLVMLDSLNKWRTEGWMAAGKLYTIHAYASVDWKDHDQVKQATYLLNGVYFGMLVPQSAMDQFKAGQIWNVVPSDGGILGGHAVYVVAYRQASVIGYNVVGPIIMTWGKRIQATWEFWDKYVDEAYAIVDSKDDWVDPENDPIDIAKLDGYLAEITGNTPNPTRPGCLPGSRILMWIKNRVHR